jgi:ribosome-binding protein aMBF1 (putative translation factor)
MNNIHVVSSSKGIFLKTCEVDNYLGTVIEEKRVQKQFSKPTVSALLQISESEWDSFVLGIAHPGIDMLKKIAKVLEVDPFELVHESIRKSKYFTKSKVPTVPSMKEHKVKDLAFK